MIPNSYLIPKELLSKFYKLKGNSFKVGVYLLTRFYDISLPNELSDKDISNTLYLTSSEIKSSVSEIIKKFKFITIISQDNKFFIILEHAGFLRTLVRQGSSKSGMDNAIKSKNTGHVQDININNNNTQKGIEKKRTNPSDLCAPVERNIMKSMLTPFDSEDMKPLSNADSEKENSKSKKNINNYKNRKIDVWSSKDYVYYFTDQYQILVGSKYAPAFSRDGGVIKKLLESYEARELKKIIDWYLRNYKKFKKHDRMPSIIGLTYWKNDIVAAMAGKITKDGEWSGNTKEDEWA